VPATEYQEIAALLVIFVVHVIGGLLLVWALLDDDTRAGWRRRWNSGPRPPDDDDPRPQPPAPRPAPVRSPLPQVAADQSAVRLRGPGKLADGHPRPPRRPEHVPQPARTPR
jgi:hypothetical protein